MKKIIFPMLLLALLLSGCFHKEPKGVIDTPPELYVSEEEVGQTLPINESGAINEGLKEEPIIEPVAQEDVNIFKDAPVIKLKDVTGGNASGDAWTVIENDRTYHKVIAKNMPALENNDFYEGWLVRPSPFDFFSTGEMYFDDNEKAWILNYETDSDKGDYSKVVITLEPDDGDPAPAEHIIEN